MGLFLFIKSLGAIWPFIKELLLGNKTVREALLRNKLTTAFVLVNIFLFILFVYTFSIARTRDAAISEQFTARGHAEQQLIQERENYERRLKEKDDYYIPLIEAKDRELTALQNRVDSVVKRLDRANEHTKTSDAIIETLRKQIVLLQSIERNPSPPALDAYTQQLEKLKQEERNLLE